MLLQQQGLNANGAAINLSLPVHSKAELLVPQHTFEFPASVCYFVYSTTDKKENKVNSQIPTRESYRANNGV